MEPVVPVPGQHRPEPPPPAAAPAEKMWKLKEVANVCRVSVRTVQNWMRRGMIPAPARIGFNTRFTADQVAVILQGIALPETYEVVPAPRAKVGAKGGRATAKKFKGKHPSTKPVPVKKPVHQNTGRSPGKLVKGKRGAK